MKYGRCSETKHLKDILLGIEHANKAPNVTKREFLCKTYKAIYHCPRGCTVILGEGVIKSIRGILLNNLMFNN